MSRSRRTISPSRPTTIRAASTGDRKSTRLNSSHDQISYAVFCLKTKKHTSELQSRSDLVCRLLLEKKNCAKAEIPAIKYNMSILGVLRTGRTPGRGGAGYSTWRIRDATPRTPLTRAGRVTADMYWERITYFLERVIPVANECEIRLACHPH